MDMVKTLAVYLLLALAAGGNAAMESAPPTMEVTPPPAVVGTSLPGFESGVTPQPTAMAGGIMRELFFRSKGEDVAVVQQRLIDIGYLTGVADGDYGRKTVRAVSAFQEDNELVADGIIGAQTLERLFAEDVERRPTPTPEPTPSPVPSPTPIPTLSVPEAWQTTTGEAEGLLSVAEGALVYAGAEPLESIFVYENAQKEQLLPLRALVKHFDYAEDAHPDGGAYAFTLAGEPTRTVAMACNADENGVIGQPMVMVDGVLYIVQDTGSLLRVGDEIYVTENFWNEVVRRPKLDIRTEE